MKAIRIFLLVLIIIGIALLATQKTWVPKLVDMILRYESIPLVDQIDYKNLSYSIDGQTVTLVNGHAEAEAVPGSASKTITQYFGNEAVGDLNADGLTDTAFLLTQNGGGSGTFYYVVVALKTKDGYQGTNAVFLGDRIAPQTTEIKDSTLVVNYADRKKDEPMTATPTVGVSKYLKVQGVTLVEEKQ